MSFNPFMEKPVPIEETFLNWNKLYPIPYCKETVDPYTKCRIILMNGTEFEAQWFSRNFSRHCCDTICAGNWPWFAAWNNSSRNGSAV